MAEEEDADAGVEDVVVVAVEEVEGEKVIVMAPVGEDDVDADNKGAEGKL